MERISSTELYLQYLDARRIHLKREPWFYTYATWLTMRGWLLG